MKTQNTLTIPANHPAFAGHFPGTPIVPGVMLLDAVMQQIAEATGLVATAWQISAVKFLSPLKPGESVMISTTPSTNDAIKFEIVAANRQIVVGHLTLQSSVSST